MCQYGGILSRRTNSRKYYSKERRYNEKVCGWKWKWKCFFVVIISAILVVIGYYAYRRWWKTRSS